MSERAQLSFCTVYYKCRCIIQSTTIKKAVSKHLTIYLKSSHVSRVASVFQTILVALKEKLQHVPEKENANLQIQSKQVTAKRKLEAFERCSVKLNSVGQNIAQLA